MTTTASEALTTGQVRRLLGITERRLNYLLGSRGIDVPIVLGRRAWSPVHVQALEVVVGARRNGGSTTP